MHVDDEGEDRLRLSEELAVDGISREIFWEAVQEQSCPINQGQQNKEPLLQGYRPSGNMPESQRPNSSSVPFRSHGFFRDVQPVRKPVGQGCNSPVEPNGTASTPKALGPRPMPQRNSLGNTVLKSIPQRKNIDNRRWSGSPHSELPLPTDHLCGNFASKQQYFDESFMPRRARQSNTTGSSIQNLRGTQSRELKQLPNLQDHIPNKHHIVNRDSLTLIRRYNSIQSNVGRMVMKHDDDSGIMTEIFTFGYRKFQGQSCQREAGRDLRTLTREDEATADPPGLSGDGFRCHLHKHNRERKPDENGRVRSSKSSYSVLSSSPDCNARSSIGRRSSGFQQLDLSETGISQPRSYNFAFQSPWNGVCEFTTGIAGRLLSCKHRNVPGGQAVAVSELRFNLPSSKAFGSPSPKTIEPGNSRETKRSSLFSSHSHRRQLPEYEVQKAEIEERLDLSLGREHAGGGFGGKQAKLGKLIIESEGLQMLDLLVANNMALWWRVYQRLS